MKTSSATKDWYKVSVDSLIEEYKSGLSSVDLSQKYLVDKGTVLNTLKKHPNWNNIKRTPKPKEKPTIKKSLSCIVCGKTVPQHRKKYCSTKCIKARWRNDNPRKLTKREREEKNEARRIKNKNKSDRKIWKEKFIELSMKYHKKSHAKRAEKLLLKVDRVKNSMVTRSKKAGVKCDITIEQLRNLLYNSYGKPCIYLPERTILLNDMAFDHIIPISKGGDTTLRNIQIITRFSNSMKGSLDENHFIELLAWLETVDEKLKKDISIRLANGIH